MMTLGWKYSARTGIHKVGSKPVGLEYSRTIKARCTAPRPDGWDFGRWRVYLKLNAKLNA